MSCGLGLLALVGVLIINLEVWIEMLAFKFIGFTQSDLHKNIINNWGWKVSEKSTN